MNTPILLHHGNTLRQTLKDWRLQGQTLALVPTMGNLHAGHLALVRAALQQADRVVVSIFVNPIQFGPNEDFDQYPRTLEQDLQQLASVGCDLVFAPSVAEMYPQGQEHLTRIHVPRVSEGLCGGQRPGHFDGVATVVTKLFNLTQPDFACFGEKDYQQLAVIRKLVADLNLPVTLIPVPVQRNAQGLALSSRNGYLTETELEKAPALQATLQQLAQALRQGERDFSRLEQQGKEQLSTLGFQPDYLEIRALDLSPPRADARSWVILAAAWLGKPRLLDNLQVHLDTP